MSKRRASSTGTHEPQSTVVGRAGKGVWKRSALYPGRPRKPNGLLERFFSVFRPISVHAHCVVFETHETSKSYECWIPVRVATGKVARWVVSWYIMVSVWKSYYFERNIDVGFRKVVDPLDTNTFHFSVTRDTMTDTMTMTNSERFARAAHNVYEFACTLKILGNPFFDCFHSRI